mgnify:CR=1 FL=1
MADSNIPPLVREVCRRLKKIWHDRDFVVGAMTLLGTEENFQKMLDFLDSHEEATPDDIMKFVIFMDEDEDG